MSKNDGGPAYPTTGETDAFGDNIHHFRDGMTLRDWFAGQALAGLLSGSPDADCGPAGYAHDAYNIADAMLAAREASDE